MKFYRVILIAVLLLVAGICVAQFRGGGGRRGFRGGEIKSARDWAPADMPTWTNRAGFEKDVFTFCRIRYESSYGGRGGGWEVDIPESDLNFSFRLQEVTSLKVHPDGVIIRLTDPELFDYPFIYIVEPGALEFTDEEVVALRRYLLNGGFLMVDDFWGEREWEGFYLQIKRVFPEREPAELPLEHPIFHSVFDLKIRPQIPGINAWANGMAYEKDGREVHYKGLFDDKGRLMCIICHNTDTGDGWEEERTNPDYFRQFSEKYAYPLGINIIFYAMTH